MVELASGARVEVRRGSRPVLLARLPAVADAARSGGSRAASEARIGAPFTDRLVAKFGLPVAGWRGQPGDRAGTGEDAMARDAVPAESDEESGGGHA